MTLSRGRPSWAQALIMVMARTVFIMLGQALFALIFVLRHHPSPWQAAAPWWTVFGTIADIGCLALMVRFARAGGPSIRDLIGRFRLPKDVFLGLGLFLLMFPIYVGSTFVSSWLVYGSLQAHIPDGQLAGRVLPLWAVIYSVSVWWLIWSPTEETTYQAYVVPRLEAASGRPWLAVLVVWFWWTLQHCALPLILDWRYVAWRFLAFAPGVLVTIMVYRHLRRLPPMIVAHWPMDIAAAVLTLSR